jgi:hypothetical protein
MNASHSQPRGSNQQMTIIMSGHKVFLIITGLLYIIFEGLAIGLETVNQYIYHKTFNVDISFCRCLERTRYYFVRCRFEYIEKLQR